MIKYQGSPGNLRSLLLFHTLLLLIWTTRFASGFSSTKSAPPTTAASSDTTDTTTSNDHHNKHGKTIVIVGGGVGGLAVAARLASKFPSHNIQMVEKNDRIGGRCGSFTTTSAEGTFRHERGPSLLLLPQVYRDVFTYCSHGKTAEDYGLVMEQCIPAYQVVFDDGDCIDLGFPKTTTTATTTTSQEAESRSRDKMNAYEEHGAEKWDAYLKTTSAYLDCGLPNFIEEKLDLPSFPAFLIESLQDFAKAWPLKPHSDVLDAFFDSDKMKALASFQDLYVGLEPYRNSALLGGGVLQSTAPAVFGLLAAIELHPTNPQSGVFAPKGGFQSVTNALERLALDLGVTIERGKTVTHVEEKGVHIADAGFLPADMVIVNADLPYAKTSLLQHKDNKNEEIFDWDDRFSFSSGVISFHWAIDKSLDDLNTHNVFLKAGSRTEAEASWQVLRNNEDDPKGAFNFYVHRAGKTDPSACPAGCDSIMVLVPCKTLLRETDCANLSREEVMKRYKEQFSDDTIDAARRAVLKRLSVLDSLKDLEQHIVNEVVDTPATWADQYHLAAGTPFALSHGFAQLSLTRPGPESSGLSNVLYCGASTRPGNGVPLVLLGAKQVAEKAESKLADNDDAQAALSRRRMLQTTSSASLAALAGLFGTPLDNKYSRANAAAPITAKEADNFSAKAQRLARPKPPKALRPQINKDFAVLLMRSSYNALDEIDCVGMEQFQRDFFFIRQAEYEFYVNQLGPGIVKQGELTDPYYFDFISFAQYATINRDIFKDPAVVFNEKIPVEVGEDQPQQFVTVVTKRDPSLSNDILAPTHEQKVGSAILQRLDETFGNTDASITRFEPNSRPDADKVLASISQLVKLFLINGYAWEGSASITKTGGNPASAAGSQFSMSLTAPANLWSGQALQVRSRTPGGGNLNNCFLLKTAMELVRRMGYKIASSSVSYEGTKEISSFTLQ